MKKLRALMSLALGVGLVLPAIPAVSQSVSTSRLEGVETGLAIKAPVKVTTTGNITLSGLQTINSVALLLNDRVLVKNQTNQKQNGIYVVKSGAWVRASDFDGNRDAVNGTLVYVTDGLVNASKFYKVVATSAVIVGTSNIMFTQVSTGSGGGGVAVNVDDYIEPTATDATTGIQAAMDAAGQRGVVQFGCAKTYVVSATLRPPYGQNLKGCGVNSTIITRTGAYGHTIEFGTDLAAAGPVSVRDMWFRHGTAYTTGDASLDNRLTDGSAHIYIHQAQGAIIENVWAWRMPYQIVLDGGSITSIQNNQFLGIWDHTASALQEGIGQVYLKASGTGGNPTILNITKNKFTGASSPLRTVSYVASDRTQNKSVVEVIGSKCGILVEGNESGVYSGNYFGGMNENDICFNGVTSPGAATLGLQITGNYFDTARFYGIDFNPASGTAANDVAISGNTFNGQFDGFGAIQARNVSGIPSVNILSVVGNSMFAHVGGPMKLFGARNATVTGNTIANYNALNVSLVDPDYTAAIQADGSTSNTNINGNTVCGLNAYSYDGIVIANGLTRVNQQSNTDGGCTRFANQQIPGPVDFLGSTSGKVTVKAAATAGTWTMTLPTTDGNLGDVIVSDGNGGLSFSSPGGISADISASTVTADGGTEARTLAKHFGDELHVRDYGAKCDGRMLTDVTATAGSKDITSTSYTFTADDVGAYVDIDSLQNGILVATSQIVSVNAGVATMADNALFNGSNRRLVMYKTDDTSAINAAIVAAKNKGGAKVHIPSGVCAVGALTQYRNTMIVGEGREVSRLYTIRGTNVTTIKSENFDALTGTGLNYGPTGTFNGVASDSRVPSMFGLADLSIMGNRNRQTGGSCVKWYGNGQYSYRVLYQDCFEYGRWTEASGAYAYSQYDSKGAEEGYFYDDFFRNIGKDAWVHRGPHDSSVEKFLAYDWGKTGTGYYAIRNESVGALYNGSSHWDDVHAYTSGGGDYKNFYLGAGGDFRFIYTDFGVVDIPSGNTKINTIYVLQCGVGSTSPCINITGDYNSIDQINFSWYSGGTLPSNLVGVGIAFGADYNRIGHMVGSVISSTTANNTLFKNRGAFTTFGGTLSNMTGASNICADIGGSYGRYNITTSNCTTGINLDNVNDSDSVEFKNGFDLEIYNVGAQVAVAGTFADSDRVQFTSPARSYIKLPGGTAANPSLVFGNNLNTGLFGSNSNLATSIAGVQTGNFDANGFKSLAGILEAGNAGTVAGKLKLNGNTSGTITMQTQAAAGTYNFNLPTTAGSSGSPLLSGGGGSSAMTYGSRSGNTTTFGTTSGTLTSGNCAEFDASGNIVDSGDVCGSGGGGGSVGPLITSITTVTANTTLTTSSQTVLCDATSGTVTLTLASAASSYSGGNGNIYTVKKIDASLNPCIISVTGGATNIDGALTQTITDQWDDLSVQSNGTQYYRLRH